MLIVPGHRRGAANPPRSKSHLHRLLIADFLAGDLSRLADDPADSEDINATKRCLGALAGRDSAPVLDCGESGSTLRFIAPVAAALGKRPVFKKAGRLADRPALEYDGIRSGLHELRGDVSSQFVTGLLFALPLLKGDSRISFTTPLESRGYVDMTLDVVRGAGIVVEERDGGFDVPGSQTFRAQPDAEAETDWSGAAFWLAANAIGSDVTVEGLNPRSAQPDRHVVDALATIAGRAPGRDALDVSQFPDSFPVLAVAAACTPGETVFTGTRRLRIKESDRVAAMADVLTRFGIEAAADEASFSVRGVAGKLKGGSFTSYGDHRIAMSIAVGATCAQSAVEIDDTACAAKSYPKFFEELGRMDVFEGR